MKPWGPFSQRVSDATIMPEWADLPSRSIWSHHCSLHETDHQCGKETEGWDREVWWSWRGMSIARRLPGNRGASWSRCIQLPLPGVGVHSCPFSGQFIFCISEHIMFWEKWNPNSMILYRLQQTLQTCWWVELFFFPKNCPTGLLIWNDAMALKDSFVQVIMVNLVHVWNIPRCQMQDMDKVFKALVCGWHVSKRKRRMVSRLSQN